ncbi:hypothetical protein MFRU_004g03070 [Monilinia fructicola]|nr:hypothetical protein MFRU_004g03070 [Monilinia fructicola]
MINNKQPIRVHEDSVDNQDPTHVDENRDCNCGRPSSLCEKGCTTQAPCSIFCTGCQHCGNFLSDPLRKESSILADGLTLHPTKSESISDGLFQVSFNKESLDSARNEENRSARTTDAVVSVSQPHYNHQTATSKHIRFHPSTATSPVRPILEHSLKNESPFSTSSKDLYHSPTRDLVDQQRSLKVRQPVVETRQPSRHSKSPSLTGSQDSLIPVSAARTPVGQKRGKRVSQVAARTHAEKLRAALACPVDELPQIKAKSHRKNPMKKKMGSLWRKIQYKFEKPLATSNHHLITSKDDWEE